MESEQEIRDLFPTPLALQFQQLMELPQDHVPWFLTRLFGEVLRFTALLALHDATISGLMLDAPPDTYQFLKRPATLGVWMGVLRSACSPQSNNRFFPGLPQLIKDREMGTDIVDALLKGRNDLSHYPPPNSYSTDIGDIDTYRGHLLNLCQKFAFLKRYTFVKLVRNSDSTVKCILQRGASMANDTFNLAVEEPHIEDGELFVLDPERRKALRLQPAFRAHSFHGTHEDFCGLVRVNSAQAEFTRCEYDSFHSVNGLILGQARIQDERSKSEGSAFGRPFHYRHHELQSYLGGWFRSSLADALFDVHLDPEPQSRFVTQLFTNGAWDQLQTLLITRPRQTSIGGRFLPERSLRSGELVDLFVAKEERESSVDDRVLVYVPAKNCSDAEITARQFGTRFACWNKIADDGNFEHVVRPLSTSTIESARGGPMIVVKFWNRASTIEEELRNQKHVDVGSVMRVAVTVCAEAHRKGIRLLALPTRHFLKLSPKIIVFTGFDTALPANTALPALEEIGLLFKDCLRFAPELQPGGCTAGETSDIFALGTLLQDLFQPSPSAKAGLADRFDDPWTCLRFHCLAQDPNMRFRSVSHFASFLNRCVESGWQAGPELATIHPDEIPNEFTDPSLKYPVRPFSIGKYPVTCFEYNQFCRDSGAEMPPATLAKRDLDGDGDFSDQEQEEDRLAGPFFPVTGVNHIDARRYCEWLSRKLQRNYRLPSESEWVAAAMWSSMSPEKKSDRLVVANFGYRYGGPTVAGGFPRSSRGCYDLLGNVWEWCLDRFPGQPWRVVKGGCYESPAAHLNLPFRRGELVTCRSRSVGLRVVCEE